MDIINYIAVSLFGLEKFTNDDIKSLGYTLDNSRTVDGRSYFTAGADAVARCNINMATAERLYINMGEFDCASFDELYEGTKALPWEKWIAKDDAFPVKGHSVQSDLVSIPDCQSIVKKAIVDRLSAKYGLSWFKETEGKRQVSFFILKNKACLMIDTTGAPLHKRGYRLDTTEAPLRETLAAALVRIARARPGIVFHDPMCGSGTIPIEAALYMSGIAPGIKRRFAAESFPGIPSETWKNARDEARAAVKTEPFEVIGSDIDDEAIAAAKTNALRAGLSGKIDFRQMDLRKISSEGKRGTVVVNPPYGERLMSMESVISLYKDMGKAFGSLEGWHVYVLTSDELFERYYGKRADKVRKLYNGMIKCNLFQYFKGNTVPVLNNSKNL
ncbi:MAG: class I SAM-dependent RNA methyltransferase [Eubacteriales bacterium]